MARRWILACALSALIGCGGGSGDGSGVSDSSGAASPRVLIKWPERTRTVSANPGALSATVTLRGGENDALIASAQINRRADPAAYSEFAIATQKIPLSTYKVQIEFFTLADAQGASIGGANFLGRLERDGRFLNSDGKPLPPITTGSEIRSFQISESVFDLEPNQLGILAYDKDYNLVPLSDGSARFRIVNGNAATLSSSGVIDFDEYFRYIEIEATLGSLKDRASVHARPRARLIAQAYLSASKVAGSVSTGKMYATTPSGNGSRALSLFEIDPNTGQLLRSVPVGFECQEIRLSPSGTVAYLVTSDRKSITRVDLVAMTVIDRVQIATASASAIDRMYQFVISAVDPLNFAATSGTSQSNRLSVYRRGSKAKILDFTKGIVVGWINGGELHAGEFRGGSFANSYRVDTIETPMTYTIAGNVPYLYSFLVFENRLVEFSQASPGAYITWDLNTLTQVSRYQNQIIGEITPGVLPNEFFIRSGSGLSTWSIDPIRTTRIGSREGQIGSATPVPVTLTNYAIVSGGTIAIYSTFEEVP